MYFNYWYLILLAAPIWFAIQLFRNMTRKRENTTEEFSPITYPEAPLAVNDDVGVNFVQVVPDSQFFTDLDQLINLVKFSEVVDKDYLITALNNTKANGYKLVKEEGNKPADVKFFGENLTNTINVLKSTDDGNNI